MNRVIVLLFLFLASGMTLKASAEDYRMLVFIQPFNVTMYGLRSWNIGDSDTIKITPYIGTEALSIYPINNQRSKCRSSFFCAFDISVGDLNRIVVDKQAMFFGITKTDDKFELMASRCELDVPCPITHSNKTGLVTWKNNEVGQVYIYRNEKSKYCVASPSQFHRYVASELYSMMTKDYNYGPVIQKSWSERKKKIRQISKGLGGDNLDRALLSLDLQRQTDEMKFVSAVLFWIANEFQGDTIRLKFKTRVNELPGKYKGKMDPRAGAVREHKIEVDIDYEDLLDYLQQRYEELATMQYVINVRENMQLIEHLTNLENCP